MKQLLNHHPRSKALARRVYCGVRGKPVILRPLHDSAVLKQIVSKPDPVIFEIGCNDGSHTRWFLEAFARPSVYCFEPDPRALRRFREKVGDPPNVHLTPIALSDRHGQIPFYTSDGHVGDELPEGWDQSGSIRKPKRHLEVFPSIQFNQVTQVTTMPLDDWCDTHDVDHIDFIWMDVQGAEMDVIRGAAKMLLRTGLLYTEYNNQEMYEGQATLDGLCRRLTEFELVAQFPTDALFQNKHFFARADRRRLRNKLAVTCAW